MGARQAVAVLVFLAAAGSVAGQPPAPVPVELLAPASLPPVPPPDPLLDRSFVCPPSAVGLWRTDVVFGLPIAVRGQKQLGDGRAWGEIGGGLYFIFPTVFAGVRLDGDVLTGRNDALTVRPGVDVWYAQGYGGGGGSWLGDEWPSFGMVSLDFDLAWNHRWSDRVHSELGLKLGAGAAFSRHGAAPLPILAVTAGFRF